MSKLKDLKKGSVLSEFQVYRVDSINNSTKEVRVVNDGGDKIDLPFDYVEQILDSADYYTKVEKRTATELSDLVFNNPRVAMAVGYTKKGKELSPAQHKKAIAAAVSKFQNAKVSEIESLVNDLISNPITKYEAGDFRVMKGISLGRFNAQGRIDFLDKEDLKVNVPKTVDPRTIEFVILKGVKYELK